MPGLLQQLGEPAAEFAQYGVRTVLDDERAAVLGEYLAGEREDARTRVAGVQVRREDYSMGVVEFESDRGSAAQRGVHRTARALAQPARAEEPVQALADGRA